ncbi:flagellar hook-length control protein FliK [Niveibacterium sp. 24ML]|uniref:flagellar hook-length control protein FliK n=1 Tax=Niveibacterium sp. 24ML TaxID=2985512 RepID=UPI00227163AB|nr:flagellar hook-length control protein FliK [Niveibacterium sp. 24ML]MCX9156144.1 flagellar hook-length control protein FliK [Niveibacterium sp. 24ML]
MIPTDLSIRIKNLLDLPLPEVGKTAPVREILPDLSPGQRFTAQVTQALPDGTFRAIVAGRTLTLSLPKSVKNGDVLELVVTRATPEAVFARSAEAAAQQQPAATLSTTGRLISHLLTGREGNAQPAPLNAGAPLLPEPPKSGAALAPLLQRAVSGSGMFYEAHQAQWVEGKFPFAQLLAEPQAKLLQSLAPKPQAQPNAITPAPSEEAEATPQAERPSTATAKPELSAAGQAGKAALAEIADQAAAKSSAGQTSERAMLAQLVPREIAPLVLNQLESLVNQQLSWQGQVWPGQTMEWHIEQPPDDAHGRGAQGDEMQWRTSLKVTLPSLGGVEARLYLTSSGVAIRFAAEDESTVARLNAALPALGTSLDAVGIPLTGAAVAHETIS